MKKRTIAVGLISLMLIFLLTCGCSMTPIFNALVEKYESENTPEKKR